MTPLINLFTLAVFLGFAAGISVWTYRATLTTIEAIVQWIEFKITKYEVEKFRR